MKKILPNSITSKQKRSSAETRFLATHDQLNELDARIELIQALIPLGLRAVQDSLEDEVNHLVGKRYNRAGGDSSLHRWGSQRGSVYLTDQKIPVYVPRVRDTDRGCEVPLRTYRRLQQPRNMDEGLLKRVINGLSCRNYRECAEAVPEAFGMSGVQHLAAYHPSDSSKTEGAARTISCRIRFCCSLSGRQKLCIGANPDWIGSDP